jgi:hypothetical protein
MGMNDPLNITINANAADQVFQDSNNKTLVSLDLAFLYLKEITSDSYMFTVEFPGSNAGMLAPVQEVFLYATIISMRYTQFGVALRYVFFFLTLASSIVYFLRLRKIKPTEYVLEQKMVLALSIVTIIFNDPFYIITVTHPNYASNVFSVMFVVNLATYLMIFWVTILDVFMMLVSESTMRTDRCGRLHSTGRKRCT